MHYVCNLFCNFDPKFTPILYMKRLRRTIIAMISCMLLVNILLTNTSCLEKNLYDEEIIDTVLSIASPVDKLDTTHTWILTSQSVYTITANINVNAKKLQILTENPREKGTATVVTQTDITDGQTVTLAASYESLRKKLYAALVDGEGAYTVTEFSTGATKVDFSNTLFIGEHLAYTPEPQMYAYGFEEEFPEPGDYDFNDIVLNISQERIAENAIQLNVKLAAVGSTSQLASAIRLVGYDYEDIDSVKTIGDVTFNKGVPSSILVVMKKDVDKLFLKGRNGEAVINLFADAHWATGDNLPENYGVITRKTYNVAKNSSSKSQVYVPRTISYLIYFKDGSRLNNFTLDTLDPFLIEDYNGSSWEVHLNEYRAAQVLYEYTSANLKNKHLPWALKVPLNIWEVSETKNKQTVTVKRYFRHTLEGVNIGFYIKDKEALFGAYATKGHAFGVWASDHTQALDWYLYPLENYVF